MTCECSPTTRNLCKLLGVCANSNSDSVTLSQSQKSRFQRGRVRAIKNPGARSQEPLSRGAGTGKPDKSWVKYHSDNEETNNDPK